LNFVEKIHEVGKKILKVEKKFKYASDPGRMKNEKQQQ